MPSQRQPFIRSFRFAFLLALVMGISSYWFINNWLTPHPATTILSEVHVPTNEWNRVLFDSDAHWVCVRRESTNEQHFLSSWKVYDLQSNGKHVWDFEEARESNMTPAVDGLLSLRRSADKQIEIIHRNFASKQVQIDEHRFQSSQDCAKMELINNGKYLLIMNRWPLWPWRLLASQGQLPLDSLFLVGNTAQPIFDSLLDPVLVTLWDIDNAKEHARIFLAPPVSTKLQVSDNGKWMVIPEAIKRTDTSFWTLPVGPTPTFQYVPALPRGARVVDLANGQVKILQHKFDAYNYGTEVGAFEATLEKDRVKLTYGFGSPRAGEDQPAIFFAMDDPKTPQYDAYYPHFELSTGEKTSYRFPLRYINKLGAPDWGVSIGYGPDTWPGWLEALSRRCGYSLDQKYPLPQCLAIRFIDSANDQQRYLYKVSAPAYINTNISANRQSITLWQDTSAGLEISRWQIPFEVYSPWWSLGISLACFMLPLMWWVWRNFAIR